LLSKGTSGAIGQRQGAEARDEEVAMCLWDGSVYDVSAVFAMKVDTRMLASSLLFFKPKANILFISAASVYRPPHADGTASYVCNYTRVDNENYDFSSGTFTGHDVDSLQSAVTAGLVTTGLVGLRVWFEEKNTLAKNRIATGHQQETFPLHTASCCVTRLRNPSGRIDRKEGDRGGWAAMLVSKVLDHDSVGKLRQTNHLMGERIKSIQED
jgi:hypothetical protein